MMSFVRTFFKEVLVLPYFRHSTLYLYHGGGGGGGRCAAGMGYTFQASKYMNGYHFHIKNISMGYLFHQKSIWMGTIFPMECIWMGLFFKLGRVYEWGKVRWLQSHTRTQNHGKLTPPPPPPPVTCTYQQMDTTLLIMRYKEGTFLAHEKKMEPDENRCRKQHPK